MLEDAGVGREGEREAKKEKEVDTPRKAWLEWSWAIWREPSWKVSEPRHVSVTQFLVTEWYRMVPNAD